MAKINTSLQSVLEIIKDDSTVVILGFRTYEDSLIADLIQLDRTVKNITLILGRGQHKMVNEWVDFVKRIITADWAEGSHINQAVIHNKIEGYHFPESILAQLLHSTAKQLSGFIDVLGLHTFLDPKNGGGKLNKHTKENLVSKLTYEGKPYLYIKTFPLHIAIIKATYADEEGNISFEKEGVSSPATLAAMAVKNSKGKVIVQVDSIMKSGVLSPKLIEIPSYLVDYIVVRPHSTPINRVFFSNRMAMLPKEVAQYTTIPDVYEDTVAQIIAQQVKYIVQKQNTKGIGMGSSLSAEMLKVISTLPNTILQSTGVTGGFVSTLGYAVSPKAIVAQPFQLAGLQGGIASVAILNFIEANVRGDVNSTRKQKEIIGVMHTMELFENTKNIIFYGSFTYDGLQISKTNKGLQIVKEGKYKAFVKKLCEITHCAKKNQTIIYITERAIFALKNNQLTLTHLAPNIRLKQDVLDQMEFIPAIDKHLSSIYMY